MLLDLDRRPLAPRTRRPADSITRRRATIIAVVLVGGLAAGCGDDDPSAAPTDPAQGTARWIPLAARYAEQVGDPSDTAVIKEILVRGDWKPLGARIERWIAPMMPGASTVLGRMYEAPTLTAIDGENRTAYRYVASLRRDAELEPSSFTFRNGTLILRPAGDAPPETAEFRQELRLGWGEAGRWRVSADRLTTDGFLVTPDHPVELFVSLPPGAELIARLDPPSPLAVPVDPDARLELRLDGEPLAVHTADAGPDLRVALPASGREDVVLSFASAGTPALWRLRTPTIGPAAVTATRPNLFVFLADTFRADNIAAYGAEHGLTPRLDAFAAESAVFERTWASASWTLPSHASLLFSAHPPQHRATGPERRVALGLVALAEALANEGWRTAAITDSMFVSQRYGLDRGFEWFREFGNGNWDLDRTLGEVESLLDRSDGRPWFVFVQTYRTHGPYRVSERTQRELEARLPDADHVQTLFRSLKSRQRSFMREHFPDAGKEITLGQLYAHPAFDTLVREVAAEAGLEELARGGVTELARQERALYLGTVHDLDRAFGGFLDLLQDRGLRDHSYVAFTSDHGELFGEHGEYRHSEGIWDPVLRIPFLLRGPDIPPGVRLTSAGHPDLAPTFVARLGLEPSPNWVGRDLFSEPDADRSLLTFESPQRGGGSAILLQWPHKIALPADKGSVNGLDVRHVYDLAKDPDEESNLAGAADYGDRLRPLVPRLLDALEPRGRPGTADVDANLQARLEAMGYVIGLDDED